jgi:hypothetical protein
MKIEEFIWHWVTVDKSPTRGAGAADGRAGADQECSRMAVTQCQIISSIFIVGFIR